MASHAPGLVGGCLGDETIAAMLEGGLSDEMASRARAHIAGCAACRRLISAAIDPKAPTSPSLAGTTLRENILAGTLIAGRYRVEYPLGEGGMGRVFVARQLGLERLVAIKILRPEFVRDGEVVKRFDREARVVASLISEHVVRVHDSGELATGEPYLVMELLEGEDLAAVLARGPVSIEQATTWILAACEALGEAHALGIIHRDIKPSNLFVTRQGRLKVLDFGLAKLAAPPSASLTGEGIILGSPRYMAPEQIMGTRDIDARADIWSLGATLYHLVTGTAPFDQPAIEAIFASILGGDMPPLDGVPPHIAGVIRQALARDPAARFATASDFAAALRTSAPRVDPRFEILGMLGQGGCATVYRARYQQGGREVALKVFVPSAGRGRDRFLREATIVSRLEHPNTVRLYEHGVGPDGAPFLVFELVRGRSLAAELSRGPLASARVARIAAQVLKAMMEAHALGIVHRDITPSNILLVDHAGEPDFVKLLDFGIAVEADAQRLTTTGQLTGTPLYMAPERIAGGPGDPRSDLYALGLVMGEAITGRPVFGGESFIVVCAQHSSPAPAPLAPEIVTSPLGKVIERAVAKRPDERFGSARDMLAAIESAPLHASPQAASPARARSRVFIAVAALAVAVATVSIAIAVSALRRDAAPIASGAFQVSGSAPSPSRTLGGSSSAGAAIIGSTPPAMVIASSADGSRAPAGPSDGDGPLGNLDESRLRTRLTRLGWTIKEVTREDFPGCHHTRLQIEHAEGSGRPRWADVFLFACDSRATAASEGARLRHGFPNDWTVDDGLLVLSVGTPQPGEASASERGSKQLADALTAP